MSRTDEEKRLLDIFDDPESLARLSPSQAIIQTFHLLLDYAILQGWLIRHDRPPFESSSSIARRARINEDDLTALTWSYVRAAYSDHILTDVDLSRFRAVWQRFKPCLLVKTAGAEISQ